MQLHIIGLGASETAQLDSAASQALQSANYVMGSPRQLETVEHLLQADQQQLILPSIYRLKQQLLEMDDQNSSVVAVLASGDPLLYGIGRWFSRNFAADMLIFYPAVSSAQVACHRLGLALQDLQVISLHGRPLAKIRTVLKSNQKLLILTDKHSTPLALAQECIAAGFGESELTVCELLGYAQEKISRYKATELVELFSDNLTQSSADSSAEGSSAATLTFDPLHVTVIDPQGPGGVLPEFPGIADDKFVTDAGDGKGMLTKREVRLAILSLLQPAKEDCTWDIGAGCGGVSIELSYWNPDGQVFAIEHHPKRLECLEANKQRFGVVSNLKIAAGRAPDALTELPAPNKVFIGGSDGELEHLLDTVWQHLGDNGVLVASAVTETTRQQLFNFYQQRQALQDCDAETLQVAVSKGDLLAGQLLYRPGLPVTLFKFIKREIEQQPESGMQQEPSDD